jgi:error-prone DNA polymerase
MASNRRVSAYAELVCRSSFSFLLGASQPEELVAAGSRLGYHALAITDECSLTGIVRAHVAARELGFPLLVGSLFEVAGLGRLVVHARDRAGYGALCALITRARRRCDKGRYQVLPEDLDSGLAGCGVLWLPVPEHAGMAGFLYERFGQRLGLGVGRFLCPDDAARAEFASQQAERFGLPVLAMGDVLMHERSRRALQDVLTAIRLGCSVAAAGRALMPNGERHLRSRRRLDRLYPAAWLAATVAWADECRFSLDSLRYEYPQELVPAGHSPASWLRSLTELGLAKRWPGACPDSVRRQVEHELALIAELAYEPFFLTVHDVVAHARSLGILCQGRGSAANSAVCYALGITEVDPTRVPILFERFVSRERREPPDIDVDFEHERREEVLQYLYRKYGRERAALAATVVSYRLKSAVRDVGKALGFDLQDVERLSGNLAWWDGRGVIPERMRELGLEPEDPLPRRLIELVQLLVGFPRHLSQHVGGVVIARDALDHLVPVENAAMPERTVIQWDKDDLDALGLLKVDCLCLGMLTAIRRAFDLLERHRGRRWTLATLPPEDPATYAMIQQADTVGVFQIESRAQTSMLPRLRPACYYDLVVQVAIVRPGPIQGQMVHPYLNRRMGREPVSYPSPEVRSVLERTLGVPIFQEQVIQLATVAAGFSPGEADQLRRSLAAWKRRGGLAPFHERLIQGMRERGYSEDFSQQICRQIQGFGEYGFPESHAASFALLVYASAWLKCHEPAAFLAALLNSQPMGFYAPAQLVADARRHGVSILPIDVCCSAVECDLEAMEGAGCGEDRDGRLAVRLGLGLVKGLNQAAATRVVTARSSGPFESVEALARRARLNRHDLDALAAADSLAGLAGNRHQARWQVLGVREPLPLEAALPAALAPVPVQVLLPLPSEGAEIIDDYNTQGFTLRRHPLALLRSRLAASGYVPARTLEGLAADAPVRVAGLVISRQRPATATGVMFISLEDETGLVNLIIWSRLVERQRKEVLGARLLGVVGTLQREAGVLHVLAHRLHDHSRWLGQLDLRSRDFH